MHHVDPVVVLGIDVGTVGDQHVTAVHVALEGGIVQGGEAIAKVLLV